MDLSTVLFRCQWARVLIRGSGPLKRKIQNHEFLSSFSLFDSWKRFYLSLDDSGLYFFENKSTTKPLLVVPIQEFISVDVDISAPVKQSAHKSIVEDINNVILCTSSGDELYIRYANLSFLSFCIIIIIFISFFLLIL
jgi:hypothetical protein